MFLLGLASSPLACFSPPDPPVAETFGEGSSSGALTGDTTNAETTLAVTGEGSSDTSTSSSSGLDSTGPDGSSTSSSDSGDSTTSEQGSSLQLYTSYLGGSGWSAVDLDDVWTGPSAPPTDGILATVKLTHFSRFIVFSDDGYTYQQVDGTWIEPVLTDELFPIVGDRMIDAAAHLPARYDPTIETLFIAADAHAIFYEIYEAGGISFVADAMLEDERNGPPHDSGQLRWAFTRTNLADPSDSWLQTYLHYDDGQIYLTDGTGTWVDSFPVVGNEFFMGNADEPDPTQAVATWYDDSSARLNVIAP